MGYDHKPAKNALKASKNNLEEALDYLRGEEKQLIKNSAILDTVESIYSDDTNNPLIFMMIYISKEIANTRKKCVICLTELEDQSIKLRPCAKEMCEYIFEEIFTGSLLTELKYY